MICLLSIAFAFVTKTSAQDPFSTAKDTNNHSVPFYSPVRAPALPLAVRSPYTSAWVSTVNNGTLNSNGAIFWNGDSLGWEGIITIDGMSYEYFGTGMSGLPLMKEITKAVPHSVSYDSEYTNFSLDAGPIRVTARFFSPVLPKDLCKTSVPLSYFEASFESMDGAPHDVQLYSDVNGRWVTNEGHKPLNWNLYRSSTPVNGAGNSTDSSDTVYNWLVKEQNPFPFGENNDHPQWGNLSYATSPGTAKKFTFQSGHSTEIRYRFVTERSLNNSVDPQFRGQAEAARWDAQLRADIASYYTVNAAMIYSNSTPQPPPPYANASQAVYTNGTDQFGQPYIFDPTTAYGFLTPDGVRGIAVPDVSEANSYYAILALSSRQTMGGYAMAVSPTNSSQPLVFQKEISSNGNINTVDVIFPAMPFFMYANPELFRMVLDPIFEIQEGGFYPNGYSIHDLGSRFPNATGHVEGNDEPMPVEESGNMILMAYAYYKFSGNKEYMVKHYPILKQFAQYLIDFSLIPEHQLSTDDFAGQLTNQTNLAIKGIVALDAISKVAEVLSQADDASRYLDISTKYFEAWTHFAIDPSSNHTLLSYQHRASWGLLYNIYPSLLLNLTVIPQSIFKMQSEWYPKVSQIYGVPLDSRHHYTKSDWQLWAAASSLPSTRRLFVNAIAYWLNHTSTDRAFTDWYETVGTGGYPEGGSTFIARPVAGGHFSLLALWKAGMDKALMGNGTWGWKQSTAA
ncbi:DUF1793-domain-containing protein [Zopfia rhizophila CBS 207.26]|uniref:DUF1793-domain-containing protein n=1 Tax=Zopfia rhizophila CBS 207.26 TaxID=1314779 RepID=A0A6A6EFD9_9PEZI|nr:DUF1793-domain-containing protein [Zopfia rhizophila CBS 207.26]